MKEIFAALAALIPVCASLWVAGAALTRHGRSREKLAKLVEIQARYVAGVKRNIENDTEYPEWLPSAARRKQLENIGIDYNDYKVKAPAASLLTEQPLNAQQLRDQWILISASALGVVFLAVSLISPA